MTPPVEWRDVMRVARKLDALQTRIVFTGGAIVSLLLDHPELASGRVTNDVDVIARVLTRIEYTDLEARLRALGCRHDTSEGAPLCRWLVEGVKVDMLPMRDPTGTLSNPWFEYAVVTAQEICLHGQSLWLVQAPAFLALKLTAFQNRGGNDFMGSHDLEDIVNVVDGRAGVVEEVAQTDGHVRSFIVRTLAGLLNDDRFWECLPGHLPPDTASQQRLPMLKTKLHTLAALRAE